MDKKAAKSLSKTPAKGGIAGKPPVKRCRVRMEAGLAQRLQALRERTGKKESEILDDALRAGLGRVEAFVAGINGEAGEPKNIIPFTLS